MDLIFQDHYNDKTNHQSPEKTAIDITKYQISKNISRKEKVDFLISTVSIYTCDISYLYISFHLYNLACQLLLST